MKPLLTAIALFALIGASPALAICFPLPDGPESAQVRNGVAHSLCLNDELAVDTAQKNWQFQMDQSLRALQAAQLQQRLDRLQVRPIQPLPGMAPTWP